MAGWLRVCGVANRPPQAPAGTSAHCVLESCQRGRNREPPTTPGSARDLRLHALNGNFNRFAHELAEERVLPYLRQADLLVVRGVGESGVGDPRGWIFATSVRRS